MQVSRIDPFVVTVKNSIPSELCQRMIETCEQDHKRTPGVTGTGYTPSVKQSTDLLISGLSDWEDIDSELFKILERDIVLYMDYIVDYIGEMNFIQNPIHDQGYQIQRTEPGGFYTWHTDESDEPDKTRFITYLWYLNDVQEGYTEFISGERVYPEEGKLLLFPATWTYQHRGTPPKSVKYICTGWMTEEVNQEVIDWVNEEGGDKTDPTPIVRNNK